MQRLLADERSAAASSTAAGYLRTLFATPRSPGVPFAVSALAVAAEERTVIATMTGYTQDLLRSLR
jgi:hypothetical protein